MTGYLVRRLAQLPVVALLVTLVLFVVVRMLPGDPVYALMGEDDSGLTTEQIEARREALGLNDPLPVQYGRWLVDLAQGDLGRSFLYETPVTDEILERVPATVQLAVASLALAVAIGVPAGTIAAVRRNSPLDVFVTLTAMFGIAIPNFWFSILLIWLFVVTLGWFPASGFVGVWEHPVDAVRYMVLPVLALGLTLSASIMRHTRSSVLEVLSQDYVRTARAKGLRARTVVVRHALRSALLPVVTVVGLQLGSLLAGSVIIESMFAIPGLGRLAVQSVNGRDYPMLQGVVLLFTVSVLVVNLLTDIAYALLDPRIRYS